MPENVAVEPPTRRRLSGKRADTVLRLSRATVEVLREVGYHDLTLQAVAARAGTARATAYTYFSSKEHLIAEVFWRRLAAAPPVRVEGGDRITHVVAVLRQVSMLVADESALAGAVSSALLGADPDVKHLRVCIGAEIRRRLGEALGSGERETIAILEVLYSGALLHGGMGHLSYAGVADLLEACARRLLD